MEFFDSVRHFRLVDNMKTNTRANGVLLMINLFTRLIF